MSVFFSENYFPCLCIGILASATAFLLTPKYKKCYQTKLVSTCPCAVKPIYWHQVVVKECTAFVAGCQAKRMSSSCSKDLNSPMTFRQEVLKAEWGRVLQCAWSACTQFWDWLASRWSFKHHQPSSFNQSRAHVLLVSIFHLVGICFL